MTSPPLARSVVGLAAILSLIGLTACSGASMERVDPSADDDVGGTLIDSPDVIAASEKAATELAKVLLASSRNDIVVAVETMKN